MPFVDKDWRDRPDHSTPITAAALEDMETRLSDYTDQQVALATGGDGPTIIVHAGSMGSTLSQAFSAPYDLWIVGTLTANLALTLTGMVGGARFRLLFTQDGVGDHTLTLNGANVPIPQTALVSMQVVGEYDGTNLYVGVMGAIGAPIIESVNTVASSGASQTLPEVTQDTINYVTLTANCTFTFPTAAAGKSFLLVLKQDGTGSRTVTWPGTVKWPGGTAPTLTTTAAKTDAFSFICVDGTNWLGFTAGLAY